MNKLLLIIILSISLFGHTTEINLLLAWKHQFQFAGYYVAKEKGYYKKAGLHVNIKEYNSHVDINSYVLKTKNTFGIGHSELILDKLNKYPKIVLLAAINQSSPLVLLSKKRKDLNKISDIVGKKIMMTQNQIYVASINAMLLSKQLQPNNYKIIKDTFNIADLINGNADLMVAYASNEPFRLQEKGIQYTIFDPKDYGYDFYSDILFTSSQMITNNPKTVQAFYKASIQGWLYAYSHIDEAVEIILKHYNTQNRTRKELTFEANTLKKVSIKQNVEFGNINIKRLKEITNTFRLLGLIDLNRKIDFSNFIYDGTKNIHLNQQKIQKKNIQDVIKSIINSKDFTYFLIILLLILVISLYFKLRMNKLLFIKTKELEKQNEIFNKNISSSKTDINGIITYVSQAFCELSQYSKDELIGNTHSIVRDTETPNDIYQDLWLTISSGNIWHGEFKNRKKDGSSYWVKSIITPIFNNKQKIIAYEAIRQDITLKKVLEEFNEKLTNEVQEQTQELKEKQQYLNSLFDINPNITYVLKNNTLELVNKAFLDFTQTHSLDDFLHQHKSVSDFFKQDERSQINSKNRIVVFKNSAEYIFVSSTQDLLVNSISRKLVTLDNITEHEKLAQTDKLTSIYNRVKLDEELLYNFNSYIRYKSIYTVIMIDIDHFKNVNDTYGHTVGDDVLKKVSAIMKENIRVTDILGRWGGEEFMIISPNTELNGAYTLAENIRIEVEKTKFQKVNSITISLGISQINASLSQKDVIIKADEALYRAKNGGRNRVES